MPEKSPETFEPSQEELSPEEKKPLESAEEADSTAEKIKALKKMKEMVEEEWLEKVLFAECTRKTNETLRQTVLEARSGDLNISEAETAEYVDEEDFKIIKKDKLVSPETGKETNINRIEFDLELTYPNQKKETLRFVSLEVPEEYRDLTKCHVYKELIKNTQGKDWAPKLKEEFDQKFITWQKEMIREKDDPQRIKTGIPLENPEASTDIKRETLKRGMRTMTIEENIILAEMLKRNGFSTEDWVDAGWVEQVEQNREKVEKFLGIKDNWPMRGRINISESSSYTTQNGKKCVFIRGGVVATGAHAGAYALSLPFPVLSQGFSHTGFRCVR